MFETCTLFIIIFRFWSGGVLGCLQGFDKVFIKKFLCICTKTSPLNLYETFQRSLFDKVPQISEPFTIPNLKSPEHNYTKKLKFCAVI